MVGASIDSTLYSWPVAIKHLSSQNDCCDLLKKVVPIRIIRKFSLVLELCLRNSGV